MQNGSEGSHDHEAETDEPHGAIMETSLGPWCCRTSSKDGPNLGGGCSETLFAEPLRSTLQRVHNTHTRHNTQTRHAQKHAKRRRARRYALRSRSVAKRRSPFFCQTKDETRNPPTHAHDKTRPTRTNTKANPADHNQPKRHRHARAPSCIVADTILHACHMRGGVDTSIDALRAAQPASPKRQGS